MIWIILVFAAICLLVRAFSNKEQNVIAFDRSMMTDTWTDEYDPDIPSASHSYCITSSPQEEQNWISSLAQPYDLHSLSVQIVREGSSLRVIVTVRGLDAEAFIKELPGNSAPSRAQRSPTGE